MFNGPYLITDISHNITPGNFETTITGVRQGIFDLPAIDSFLQSINKNLLIRNGTYIKSLEVSGNTFFFRMFSSFLFLTIIVNLIFMTIKYKKSFF
jgi:hypothetical protein